MLPKKDLAMAGAGEETILGQPIFAREQSYQPTEHSRTRVAQRIWWLVTQ
jgi:hypothetical protein